MNIALLSDTHSFFDDRMEKYLTNVDEIWHAGDIGTLAVTDRLSQFAPLRAVYGNIDGKDIQREFPEHQFFMAEGKKVWMTHIGGYPPKYTRKLKAQLDHVKPDIFVCGHSHILRIISDPDRKLLHLNPGAAGNHGFHKIKTLVLFEINLGRVENMRVVELASRGS